MKPPDGASARIVPILLYHFVSPGEPPDSWTVSSRQLSHHLDLIKQLGAHTLRATEYAQACRETSLPDHPIVLITFDDAQSGVADIALPLLAERGLVATFFVTTDMVGTTGNVDRAALRAIDPDVMEIGSHTVSHVELDVIRRDHLREEVSDSRQRLEDIIGRPVTSFAYPHGYHRRLVCDAVKDAGYETAHAVRNALSYVGDDLYALARLTVRSHTPDELVARWLRGQGAPVAGPGESIATKTWRQARRLRNRTAHHGR